MSLESGNQKQELPSISTSLLERAQQMQPEAWARLVEVFSPIVYRWGRQAGLTAVDSADVVQDVFISVARNIPNFQRQKETASFRSWLATITRNRIRDWFRRQQKIPDAVGGTEAWQRIQNQPDDAYVQASDSEVVVDELDKTISLADLNASIPQRVLQIVRDDCDERTWNAFWQTVVLGDAAKDVALRLNMSVASVYQAKSRILRRLRKRLDELP